MDKDENTTSGKLHYLLEACAYLVTITGLGLGYWSVSLSEQTMSRTLLGFAFFFGIAAVALLFVIKSPKVYGYVIRISIIIVTFWIILSAMQKIGYPFWPIGEGTPMPTASPSPIPEITDPSGKIAAGDTFSLLLKSDKTVSTYGGAERIDTSDWENIIQIAAYQDHAIGLCEGGRVVVTAADRDEYDVGDWSGIKQVAACVEAVIGVTEYGSVLLEGPCRNCLLECTRWENVDRIIAAGEQIIARKYDGTLITARKDNDVKQLNAKHDSDIISVAVAEDLIFLVHEDGIVKIVGDAQGTVASIADWSSISEIALGETFVVGRRRDGTVQKLGKPKDSEFDVKSWSEITVVCAGKDHTIGLRKDGTVLATGLGTSGQCGIHGESYWVGN